MAGASLLALLDDITSMLDDIALMTKVAAKKTVGVLGDDLALNAQQVSGSASNRELPVIWAVAKGSLLNKAVLIPAALLISAFAPWLITPLLMIGGAYLSFEGAEKIIPLRSRKGKTEPDPVPISSIADPVTTEKKKVQGAIRTDFILSTEIVVIALGSLPEGLPFLERTLVLCMVGICITAGVYGVVAAIVRLDDAGLLLIRASGGKGFGGSLGRLMVGAMPHLMRMLTIAGTVAMFMVGGGILAHGIPWLETTVESLSGLFLPGIKAAFLHICVGMVTGMAILGIVTLGRRLSRKA